MANNAAVIAKEEIWQLCLVHMPIVEAAYQEAALAMHHFAMLFSTIGPLADASFGRLAVPAKDHCMLNGFGGSNGNNLLLRLVDGLRFPELRKWIRHVMGWADPQGGWDPTQHGHGERGGSGPHGEGRGII